MAIDTKEKRAGVLGVGRPWVRDKLPTADLDEQWRIASGNAYGGNALSFTPIVEEEVVSGGSTLKVSRKDKKREKKLAQSRKIIEALKAQGDEQRKRAAQDDNGAQSNPVVNVPPVAPSSVEAEAIKPSEPVLIPFARDERLSKELLEAGEASGFLNEALKREQDQKELERLSAVEEQRRLDILADDELVIALYLQRKRELIEAFLTTR